MTVVLAVPVWRLTFVIYKWTTRCRQWCPWCCAVKFHETTAGFHEFQVMAAIDGSVSGSMDMFVIQRFSTNFMPMMLCHEIPWNHHWFSWISSQVANDGSVRGSQGGRLSYTNGLPDAISGFQWWCVVKFHESPTSFHEIQVTVTMECFSYRNGRPDAISGAGDGVPWNSMKPPLVFVNFKSQLPLTVVLAVPGRCLSYTNGHPDAISSASDDMPWNSMKPPLVFVNFK